jgi:glycosyltransferase involved in cell wall biosynthesis
MRILFYVGYFEDKWSPLNLNGVGGSEICVVEISKRLKRFGHRVYVCGDVESGNYQGVVWVSKEDIHQNYFNEFDLIIGVNYIHFLLEFENYTAKKIFWVHNTDYHPWYKGEELPNHQELLNSDKIDYFITLTDWHKNFWSKKYSIPFKKIIVIGNGIDKNTFIGTPKKKPGKFIWSSHPERGLWEILENWSYIKTHIPEATLDVFHPDYFKGDLNRYLSLENQGVSFMGSVSRRKLHYHMLSSEYWLYLTSYKETFCITALEMQFSGVIPITTETAALKETVHSGIRIPDGKNKFQESTTYIKSLTKTKKKKIIKENIKKINLQSWDMKSLEWKKIIDYYESR